ncbi:ABC transporter substrate-binding protein [Embleya sp. AB8]|uniref:ABC transporter substrate-binding protein n=1 Tax=Embleya sp. AB8 TaxID=3156304 RepID=UPI003C73EB93
MPSWNDDPNASTEDDASANPPPRPTYAPMAVPPPPQQPAGPPPPPQYPAGPPPVPQYPGGPPQYPDVPPPPPSWGPQPPAGGTGGGGSSRRNVLVAGSVAAVVAAGGGVAAWLLTRDNGKSAAPKPSPPPPTTGPPAPPVPPPTPDAPPATESAPYTLTVWQEKIFTPGVDQAKTNTDLGNALVKVDPLGSTRMDVQEFIDQQKLDTALAAGNGPDIFQLDTLSLARRVRRGTLLDLTPYAGRLNVDGWHPAARAACTFDGKLYALPMDVYVPVVIYDKRLCDPAGFVVPHTRDEWFAELDKLKRFHASDPKFEALHLTGKAWQQLAACLFEAGCEIAVRDGEHWTGRLGTPAGKDGIGYFQRLQAYSSAPKNVEEYKDPAGSISAVLTAGKAAMVIQPDWVFADLLRSSPETARNLAAFPMPGPTSDKPGPVGVWGGVFAVNAKTAHPVGASNLLRVLSSAPWQERWANENETPPAMADLTTTSGTANLLRPATLAALKESRPYPQAPGWTAGPLKDFAEDVLAKGLDPSVVGPVRDLDIARIFNRDS